MRGASLLLVFVLAKLAVLWGHTGALTGWDAVAYFWQDVMVAMVFGLVDLTLRRIGTPVYWALVAYAAINIPVGRAVFTPLTWPMLRAARGPLADSMSVYLTAANVLLVVVVLFVAWVAPRFVGFVRPVALVLGGVVVLLGAMAGGRVDTRGMDRNVVTALLTGVGGRFQTVPAFTCGASRGMARGV